MNNINMNNNIMMNNMNKMNNQNIINNSNIMNNMNMANEVNIPNQSINNNKNNIRRNSQPKQLGKEENNNTIKEQIEDIKKNIIKNEIPKQQNSKLNTIIDFNETKSVVISKNKDKKISKFESIKKELYDLVQKIIKKNLDNKNYNQDQASSWCNSISDEIIKTLSTKKTGFKFACSTTIFEKGNSCLNFSSTCLWYPAIDGSLVVKYENEQIHCFVNLCGISP